MKIFAISDVHGFYDQMIFSLNEKGFDVNNKDHVLISCGDLLDRGPKPRECLNFIMSLPAERRILICGNHEDLIIECMNRRVAHQHDIHNGTDQTIRDLTNEYFFELACDKLARDKQFNSYITDLVDYAEIGNYIFVHGWIPCFSDDNNMYHSRNVHYTFNDNWRKENLQNWERARWINGMDAWWQGIKISNKTIVCGHWHTSWARRYIERSGVEWDNPYSTNPNHRKADFSTWKEDGIIALDACTAYSYKVNCEVIEIEDN